MTTSENFSTGNLFKRQFVQTALAIAASVLAVAGFVYGATTIGTNISVDGNLTVSGTSATSTFSGGLTAGNNAALVINQVAPANSLYIAANGNVGFGTTSPTARLQIPGTTQIVRIGSGSTSPTWGGLLTVSDNKDAWTGDIAIGVVGKSSSITVETISGAFALFGTDNGQGPVILGSINNFPLTFRINNGERVRLDISGNLGIGTTSPAQLLSVAGDAYIAGTGTTTLNLKTTTASKGTCIEMFDSGGAVRRLYINAAGAITVEAGTYK